MGSLRTAKPALLLTAPAIAKRKLTPADTLILKSLFPYCPDKIAVTLKVRVPLGVRGLASPRTGDEGVCDVRIHKDQTTKPLTN